VNPTTVTAAFSHIYQVPVAIRLSMCSEHVPLEHSTFISVKLDFMNLSVRVHVYIGRYTCMYIIIMYGM